MPDGLQAPGSRLQAGGITMAMSLLEPESWSPQPRARRRCGLRRHPAATPAPLDPRVSAVVERVVRHLPPRRVILFGSRARGDHAPKSDIDLAVVDAESPLLGRRDLLLDLQVAPVTLLAADLVFWDEVDDAFRARVEREGWVLYDRPAA